MTATIVMMMMMTIVGDDVDDVGVDDDGGVDDDVDGGGGADDDGGYGANDVDNGGDKLTPIQALFHVPLLLEGDLIPLTLTLLLLLLLPFLPSRLLRCLLLPPVQSTALSCPRKRKLMSLAHRSTHKASILPRSWTDAMPKTHLYHATPHNSTKSLWCPAEPAIVPSHTTIATSRTHARTPRCPIHSMTKVRQEKQKKTQKKTANSST
ncbi:unnamed protein product [Mesocestoides corti]|uniref:Secreted protein n=1 Tax=Mesocestoides corti TaxID=53468 RepID=A0A0R3UNG4_MESCO|nr:unnamed protein product [Mesocestoides corti]